MAKDAARWTTKPAKLASGINAAARAEVNTSSHRYLLRRCLRALMRLARRVIRKRCDRLRITASVYVCVWEIGHAGSSGDLCVPWSISDDDHGGSVYACVPCSSPIGWGGWLLVVSSML